jgi:hypothetical protein
MRPPFASRLLEWAQTAMDQRRLLIGLCVAVAVALVAAIPGILTSAGGEQKVHTSAAPTTSPTTAAPGAEGVVSPVEAQPPALLPTSTSTTRPALVLGTAFIRPSPTLAPKPSTPASTAPPKGSPPTSVCRNSYDPACGPFSWDPAPAADQPEQVTLTPSKATVKVGERVDFDVVITDADNRQFVECAFKWDYGDGSQTMTTHCDPDPRAPNPCPTRYGPWTPPSPEAGREQFPGIGHSYSTPGTYTVAYTHDSRPNSCYNPYASAGSQTVMITVTP